MTFVFATHNAHKLEEALAIVPKGVSIVGLGEVNFTGELPETSGTIRGNALQKAREFHRITGLSCIADDTGLEVISLHGAPGVDTAHSSGSRDSVANMKKLLHALALQPNRSARFVTVIACIRDGQEYIWEGEVKGEIAQEMKGSGGFGYDPVFIPEGYQETFAELPQEVKNTISHRARALQLFAAWLANNPHN